MYTQTNAATVLQVAMTAAMLIFTVFLTGCASKKASRSPSHFGGQYARSTVRAPAPVPAVRGYARRQNRDISGLNGHFRGSMNDEQRYSAIYGVPARRDYLATAEPATKPALNTKEIQPANKFIAVKRIVVTQGDTLYNIAGRYQVSVATLQRVNKLGYGNLQVGQELKIPVSR